MQHYGLTEATAPASEPVTKAEAKLFARIDITDDDDLVDALIEAARREVESFTRRSLINTTWDMTLDCFPATILLPRSPLSSVTSISYVDTSGTTQTLTSTLYRVDTASLPGRITNAYGQTWPATQAVTNAVTVKFVAGYGATAASVPEPMKLAIKIMINDWYEHRESQSEIKLYMNKAIERLLWSYRVAEAS